MDFLGGMNFMTKVRVVTENKKIKFSTVLINFGRCRQHFCANFLQEVDFPQISFLKPISKKLNFHLSPHHPTSRDEQTINPSKLGASGFYGYKLYFH